MSGHDWTPILSNDGQFYCSPRCGGGKFCRKEWHDHAVFASAALAQRLGDGWEPRVWENLGWHYEVVKGNCRVIPYEDRTGGFSDGYPIASYGAWIEGEGHPQIIAQASTPEDAIGFAIQDARTLISRIEGSLSFARVKA